jgi:kynureninase
VPFTLAEVGNAFVVAGGYKYAQWGEGTCFLRVPPNTGLRPVYTGWYAGFADLDAARVPGRTITYPTDGAEAFAGSTFDPASFYRALAVTRFMRAQGLDIPALRALSLRQTQRLIDGIERIGLSLATPVASEARGGFVAIEHPRATALVDALRADAVYTDARGTRLRLGPAPYVTDDEIDRALVLTATLTAAK